MTSRMPLYINYYKKVIRSHLRLILTLSGLVLSVMILLVGFVFSETYFYSNYAAISDFKQSKLSVVSGKYDYEIYRNIADLDNSSAALELVRPYSSYTISKGEYMGHRVSVSIRDIRTNNIDCNMLYGGQSSADRYSGKLLYGRLLNQTDIDNKAKVVVVNATLAALLFGQENAVGEKINIPVYQLNYQAGTMEISYYEQLLIVGVVSASSAQKEELARIAESDEDSSVIFSSYVYIPLSLSIAERKAEEYDMAILSYSKNDQAYRESIAALFNAVHKSSNSSNYRIQNYYTLGAQINSAVSNTKSSLLTIIIFLFLASGLLIVNTMFFSVKERINEVGIRKAIGAFDSDIVKQFVFEGFLYGIMGACIGIVCGLMICSAMFIILGLERSWNVHLIVSMDAIVLCFLLPLIVGTAASVLPALYASKIKITDAIKSE